MVSTPIQTYTPFQLYKMSSLSLSNLSVSDLLNQRSLIDAEIFNKTGGAVAAPTVKGKAGRPAKEGKKAPGALAGKPAVYGSFSSKIQKEHAEEIKAFKEANPEMKGAHMSWVGNYKKEHAEEYEAFKKAWEEEHPKVASSAEVSDAEAASTKEAKPKKVLSPEHKAKMQDARKAKKLERDAEKAAALEEAKEGAPVAVKKVVKKAAKKAADLTPTVAATVVATVVATVAATEAVATVAATVAAADEDAAEELPFTLAGATYIRLGVKRADSIEWASGDLWNMKKGKRGSYKGELMEDGSINEDAEEPELE